MNSSYNLFSEANSKRWINFAIGFAVFTGVATSFFAIRTPPYLPRWAIVDGILLLGLAYGLWKRSQVCAVLLIIHAIGSAIINAIEFGSELRSVVVTRIILYMLAAAAINVERDRQRLRANTQANAQASHGSADNQTTG